MVLSLASSAGGERHARGRALLHELVGDREIVAICPDCGGPHGRPVAVDGPAISLTHVGDTSIAVSSDADAVGVDAERHDADTSSLAIVAGDVTVEHWTRVEAVLKADGRGLRVDPLTIEFDGDRATLDGRVYALRTQRMGDLVVSTAESLTHVGPVDS